VFDILSGACAAKRTAGKPAGMLIALWKLLVPAYVRKLAKPIYSRRPGDYKLSCLHRNGKEEERKFAEIKTWDRQKCDGIMSQVFEFVYNKESGACSAFFALRHLEQIGLFLEEREYIRPRC
jgi:hypothetical protein